MMLGREKLNRDGGTKRRDAKQRDAGSKMVLSRKAVESELPEEEQVIKAQPVLKRTL